MDIDRLTNIILNVDLETYFIKKLILLILL